MNTMLIEVTYKSGLSEKMEINGDRILQDLRDLFVGRKGEPAISVEILKVY